METQKINLTVDVTQPVVGYDGKAMMDPKFDERGEVVRTPRLDADGKPVVRQALYPNGQGVFTEKGEPVMVPVADVVMEPVPIRIFACKALEQVGKGQQAGRPEPVSAADATMTFRLLSRIYTDDSVSFTPDELTFLDKQMLKVWPPVIYGACAMILNGTGPTKKD
jgi:hypothetical protein